jgi:hypothetical protein
MANKWRGEVPFPALGEGVYISFPLEDLAELEDRFGEKFFEEIERLGLNASPKAIPAVLTIGVKQRLPDGAERKVWQDIGPHALREEKFKLSDAFRPIMDAIAISWLQKTYDELVAEAVEARKKADADKMKRAKEAAEEAGLPFDEALLEGLSRLLINAE